MVSINEVKRFQEFLLNSWPAEHYFFLHGWILRFNQGVTYRANSVFPINYNGKRDQLGKDLEIVEMTYNQYGLPCIFTMHDFFEPDNLDKTLKERGYFEHNPTNALFALLEEIKSKFINRDFEYEILGERTKWFSEFLANNTQRDHSQQKIINQIVNRIVIPKKCFIIAKKENEVFGTIMGVLNVQGYLYIADLFVSPRYRRSGIASSLMMTLINDWGLKNGLKYVWLQVEKENNAALIFYKQLGMKKAYEYYYLRKDF